MCTTGRRARQLGLSRGPEGHVMGSERPPGLGRRRKLPAERQPRRVALINSAESPPIELAADSAPQGGLCGGCSGGPWPPDPRRSRVCGPSAGRSVNRNPVALPRPPLQLISVSFQNREPDPVTIADCVRCQPVCTGGLKSTVCGNDVLAALDQG